MDLVGRLTVAVADVRLRHDRVLVGIDGPDAAGKTTLADRLAARLPGAVLGVSIDDFVRPRDERYRQGELSPRGCYEDSFDIPALVDRWLAPFRDGALVVAGVEVPPVAVLVVDGVFLLRPGLRDFWTLSVHLTVPDEVSLRRAQVRDLELFGSAEEVERRYRARYLPAQALYRALDDPERIADIVVDNQDPTAPRVLRWGAGLSGADSPS